MNTQKCGFDLLLPLVLCHLGSAVNDAVRDLVLEGLFLLVLLVVAAAAKAEEAGAARVLVRVCILPAHELVSWWRNKKVMTKCGTGQMAWGDELSNNLPRRFRL